MGPHNLLGRVYQAIPISITVEGANILTRSMIIFGQGAIRCHPYVLKEMQAVAEQDAARASADFDRALFGHIGFTLSNAVRAWWLGVTGARFASAPGAPDTRRYYQQLTRMSAAFAVVSDIAMLLLGGKLKRKEKLSGRLADVLSHLYLASCALKHFEDAGRPRDDLPLVRWSCEESLWVMQDRLDDLLQNFPSRYAAWVLRRLVFPLGRRYRVPDDRLGRAVAQIVMEPSATRDRLTTGAFLTDDPDQSIGRIDDALRQAVEVEAVERKLVEAVRAGQISNGADRAMLEQGVERGVIDADEAARYRNALAARRAVITVDDFPQGYWNGN